MGKRKGDITDMKKEYFLRLAELTVKDFMGVEYGKLAFSRLKRDWNEEEEFWKSNVIGIYGPNGSGKTTVIESLQLLKDIINTSYTEIDSKYRRQLKQPLSGHYIRVGAEVAELSFLFYCCSDEGPTGKRFRYSFSITGEDPFEIENELFQVIDESGEAIHSLSTKGIAKDSTEFFESFAYSNQNIPSLVDNISLNNDMSLILQYDKILPATPAKEARFYFHQFTEIINSYLIILLDDITKAMLRNDSVLPALTPLIPFSRLTYLLDLRNGYLLKNSYNPNYTESNREILLRQVSFLSDTIESLVPDISLSVKNEENKLVMYVDKDEVSIPFAKESYGIKKLVYLCCYLPVLFQSPAYMLFFDELDEGLFEHLLGSILLAIQDKAEGQLIFTAHNLRPLQCLEHGSIRFALLPNDIIGEQSKKPNQYSEINCLNKRSNLRDIYYRIFNFEDVENKNY